MVVTCAQCGEKFEGKRSTAKFCGARCRQQSRRAAPAEQAAAIRPDRLGVVEIVATELASMGKTNTVLGAQALQLAERLTSSKDTGSAIAAVSRELDRVMVRLSAGAAKQEDQLASARRRRDEKRRAAAEASEA
ncbi:hypothetical protein [Nocardioides sp. GY 10127]|uniref:hypothetical protein n=1 Tax=Nocardioides sp. GY 10127 TaxID=2569762 RepID=UPI0010A7CEFA|nr:hypothetical protein [Nocardioides sp. GY 10127]TIC78789.1 hypothetical protein E8D37_19020 [Nocardioides sp. GY 10127]